MSEIPQIGSWQLTGIHDMTTAPLYMQFWEGGIHAEKADAQSFFKIFRGCVDQLVAFR